MRSPELPKRSKYELKRLVENAVVEECRLEGRGLWFCVDELEVSGHPPERIKVWATLHFLPEGSPFCCGEPDCELGTFQQKRLQRIGDHVRRAMGLEQPIVVDIANVGTNCHEGVTFTLYFQLRGSQSPPIAFEELNAPEYERVWDRVYAELSFRPSVHRENWPGIKEPIPSITYDISRADPHSHSLYEFNHRLAAAFRQCINTNERLYALDWQHPCYWFDPNKLAEPADPSQWKISPLPDGDYSIFLAADFRWGIFGHPWEQTMCIFGDLLLRAVSMKPPKVLNCIVRRNGQPENPNTRARRP